jgi:hypothetical protein
MQVTCIVWKRHVVLGGGAYLAVTRIHCYTDISDCSSHKSLYECNHDSYVDPPGPFSVLFILNFFRHCVRVFCFIVKMSP